MLKKLWFWSSLGLILIGCTEAWLSNFGYIPFCWVVAGLMSATVLILKALLGLTKVFGRCFGAAPYSNFESYFGSKSHLTNKAKGHSRQATSSFDDPLNPNSMHSDYDGDPFIDPTHPMHHLYDDIR